MQYKTIYSFLVWDEIKNGNKVFCLDRGERIVFCVNNTSVATAMEAIKRADNDEGCYEFWIETEADENA